MWGNHSKESVILSLPEVLIFFGIIAIAIVAAIVALASAVIWLIQHFHHVSDDNNPNVQS